MDNLALARRAWSDSESSSSERDRSPLFDLLAEEVVLEFTIPEGTPISGKFQGRQNVIDFYTTTSPSLVDDGHAEGPLQFGAEGDRVLILGTESYTVAKSGTRCRNKEFAIALDFRDGQITRILQIKDFTEFVEAYAGD